MRPQALPIRTARAETGLAAVGGVTLMETRKREGRDVWTPIDQGSVYFSDRRLVFVGKKSVEFRLDRITANNLTPEGLHLAVSTRKGDLVLAGPADQMAAMIAGAQSVAMGLAATAPFENRAGELRESIGQTETGLEENRADRGSLVKPPRPVSPAWVPGTLLFGLFLLIAPAGGSPSDDDPVAAATTTIAPVTSTSEVTDTTVATTTTSRPPSTTTVVTFPQSDVLLAAPVAGLSGDPGAPLPSDAEAVTVLSITDGDTLDVRFEDGNRAEVRLIGINTPEANECFSEEATLVLGVLAQVGSQIGMTTDVSDVDQFDRLLRYLWFGGMSVNEESVRRGAAISRRYAPDTAMAERLDTAQAEAKEAGLGLWAPEACGPQADASLSVIAVEYDAPGNDNENLNEEWIRIRNDGDNVVDMTGWMIKDESASNRYEFPPLFAMAPGESVTIYSGCGDDFGAFLYWCGARSAVWNNDGDTVFLLDPNGNNHTTYTYGEVTTTTQAPTTTEGDSGGGDCDPSYPDVCIASPPPDLNCDDVPFKNIRVVGSDPHGFDGNDNDGLGCES
jgi:micrococcal nuclease